MADTDKTFTLSDIAKHNSVSDCWTVIEGKVYNLTDYLPKHHGGPIIIKACGIDATYLFNERPDAKMGPHPESARDILKSKYIGELAK